MLKEKLDGNSDKLSQEILRLEQNIVELNDKHLHQIITRENIDSVFSISNTNEIGITTNFNDIKGSEYFDLLKYIIRNGYIDESYADYMTYFYENSLSRVDKTFLRSVTDKKAKEYTYKLKNPQLVVSRLRLADFGQEETLNFDLLTYLLKSSRKDYIERFIDQLKQTNNFDFVGAYFDLTAELPNYIKHLNIGWPEMFSTALSEQSLTEAQIRKYSIFSLYYSDDDIIKLINKNNCLSDYISEAYDYLTIDNPNIDRLIHCFMLLDVRFKGFDYDKIQGKLCIRHRTDGDRIVVNRAGTWRKLKKEFIDRKVPADMRDNVLVVSDDSGVLWAVGVRRSECALIDDETRNVLDITIQ